MAGRDTRRRGGTGAQLLGFSGVDCAREKKVGLHVESESATLGKRQASVRGGGCNFLRFKKPHADPPLSLEGEWSKCKE